MTRAPLTIAIGLICSQLFASQARAAEPEGWQIGPFLRPAVADVNPVIKPNPASVFDCPMRAKPIHWEALHAFNPAAVVKDGKVCVLYRAEDDTGDMHIGHHTSRLGLATSDDGLHFERRPEPVFFPTTDDQKEAEWDGGCEDPRIVAAPDGSFVLTYTQWNHKLPRLAVATSPDLLHWTKHGTIFPAGSEFRSKPTKSGAILGQPRESDGQIVAAKVNGKFWMYWGEGDMRLATSEDLIHWTVVESSPGKSLIVLPRRKGRFDSSLAEGGPSPILTDHGIVVVYNGRNGGKDGDKSLGNGAYADGQALFDKSDPTKLLSRPETPFYKPEAPFEKTGQYAAGTTFAEGLVRFNGKWFMYYGCADSFVGVAVCEH